MYSVPPLLTFLLMAVSAWVHRHQLCVIEFLQAENRMLKEGLRGKRIRFTGEERALLARKAKAVGRKALLELDTIVSPDTLMRWHRRLEYMAHFHEERNHQGLENRLERRKLAITANDTAVDRRTRLGELLSYYHRVAA